MSYGSPALDLVQAVVALVLLGLAVWALPLAFWRARAVLSGGPPATPGRLVLVAVAAAALLRLVVAPPLLATVFIGYKQTEQALALLPVSHYGVGATALYHALFAVLPADHRAIVVANAVMGAATLPLLAALVASWLSDRRAGALAALLVALTPLFVRNDASEANQVPTLLFLAGGLVLLDAWLREARPLDVLAAAPLLALAATCRPEALALVAGLGAVTKLAHPPRRALLRTPWPWLASLAFAAAVAPHLLHVLGAIDTLEARGSLPGAGAAPLERLAIVYTDLNVVLRPALFPVGVTALAALGLALRGPGPRRVDLALAALAALAVALYAVDLDRANMARVLVPSALLVTVLAGAGLSRLAARTGRPWVAAAALAAALATAWPSVGTLWQPTNEATEERLVRAALEHVPAGPFTLVRPGGADRRDRRGSAFTHYHFPDYLFRPPARDGVVRSVSGFLDAPSLDEPTLFFRGLRCYADFRFAADPRPAGADELPACAALRARFRLTPLVEWEVPNRGDVWIRYYGDAPTLTVGLYRIEAPRDAPPAP